MSAHEVWVELDVSAGSPTDLAAVGVGWVESAAGALASDVLERLASKAPQLPKPAPDAVIGEFKPDGPPLAPWGRIHLSWPSVPGSVVLRAARRKYSTRNLAWLRARMEQVPVYATVDLTELDEDGFRTPGLSLWVHTDAEAPGWVRLLAPVRAVDFTDPETGAGSQRRWLEFLREFAGRVNPRFGHISYWVDGGGPFGQTPLEHCLPYPLSEPWTTVRRTQQRARGYSWLTILAQELAERLGGVAELRRSGAFAEVEQLSAGGVWLLATRDFRDYDLAAARRIFEVLAPVLPPGMPRDRIDRLTNRSMRAPLLVVMEDPTTRRGS